MKPYVVGQDKHRILDENWGRYKDNAISSSQPAAAPSAPPAPPSVAAIAPAPGSHAPSLPAPPSVAAPCSPAPGSLAPAPGSPAQIGQPAPVQIMQSACDSHSLPFFISKGPFSYLRVGRIDSKTNQWRSMYTALHRLDDIYVFLIDEHYFDYPSIAKTAATAEKASFPQAGGHPGKSSSPRHFIASLRTRVYLGEDTRKEVFETLRDLESLRVACGRTKKIEGNFDYADCAVNYVGNLDIIVNTYDDKDWKEVWNHIKDKRKKDLEAQAAREAAKAVRVTQAAAKARPS
ncbi:hypothetical protein FB446DRAFT_740810 [Lentinula raphanica]|nr:hypothetical protein FB446DRAFT_740810 [Lentinula raphanica]